jgi:hypothetical protein
VQEDLVYQEQTRPKTENPRVTKDGMENVKPTPPAIPKPQHLSKTQTPLTNDPLWLEAFVIDGDRGFIEEAGEQKFTITADSFITLSRRTYETVCAADKEFGRHVSPGMYQYYNVIHFWARIAAIRDHYGYATDDEKNLIRYLSSREHPLHEPINAYLRGIGDFSDPSGTEHKFRLLRLPSREDFAGIGGFFGPVCPQTHHLYEPLPSPGVAALKVLNDLLFTRDPRLHPVWDLPDDLRPEPIEVEGEEVEDWEGDEAIPEEERREVVRDVHELRPTANLLCWSTSVRLTNEQRQTVEACGIDEEGFADDFVRYSLSNGLFEALADRVRTSADRYKFGASLHEHQLGSLAQCPYVEREPKEHAVFSRTKLYSEGGIRASCAFQLDERMSVATRVMAFRMRKEPIGGLQSWPCYDFNQYLNVPEDWIETRNTVFNYGQVIKLQRYRVPEAQN